MKSKEELNAIKEEIETLNCKLRQLTEEELEPVTGGLVGKLGEIGKMNDPSYPG